MVENKRRTESKQMILSAFEKKLAAVDYKNIKINDLCDDALIGKRTFYRCFRDLDDLLDTYIYHHLSQFFNLFDPGEAAYASAKEYFTAVFTAVYKNESQFFLIIENNKLWDRYQDLSYNFHKGFVSNSFTQKLSGIMQPRYLDYYLDINLGVAFLLIRTWTKHNFAETPEELAEFILPVSGEFVLLKDITPPRNK